MKGQNPLLSHVFATAFLVILVIGIIQITNSLRSEYQDFISDQEVQQVCSIMKSSVTKLNRNNNYLSLNQTLKGRIYIDMPEKIAGETYRIRFMENNASVETPTSNTTCTIGYNATYRGTTTGGRIVIEWKEFPVGETVIEVVQI
jgi:hypothetical protein